jgi:hypothetical protein
MNICSVSPLYDGFDCFVVWSDRTSRMILYDSNSKSVKHIIGDARNLQQMDKPVFGGGKSLSGGRPFSVPAALYWNPSVDSI